MDRFHRHLDGLLPSILRVHVAVVRVDAATGGVTFECYFVAYDIGRAVTPMLVEG